MLVALVCVGIHVCSVIPPSSTRSINRYPNQTIKAYLQDYGCDVDSDVFALSELVQWVWRSAIRNNQVITLCIASSRMKKLFIEWLDSGY